MTNRPYVLIVSTIADVATDDVIRRLSAKSIEFLRINSEDFPFARKMAFHPTTAGNLPWLALDSVSLRQPSAIWYRRMRSAPKPNEMDPGVYQFCMQENRAALLGAIVGSTARWMSHPSAVWQSELKPFQLSAALQVGLRIPRTVITNDPLAIRKAFSDFGEMIVKPVRSGHVVCSGESHSIYTSQVLRSHLDELDSATLSPAIYQELVPKRFDIRVTIVGDRIFSAAIDSQSDPKALVDWRQTSNPLLPHHPIELPPDLSKRLLDLMRLLGLSFAAIDLVQTPDGEFVFLEVNPSGQWLWIDDMLNLGISDAVADWLSL